MPLTLEEAVQRIRSSGLGISAEIYQGVIAGGMNEHDVDGITLRDHGYAIRPVDDHYVLVLANEGQVHKDYPGTLEEIVSLALRMVPTTESPKPSVSCLNALVTAAIVKAEHLEALTMAAYLEVSKFEADLASNLGPDSVEGSVARQGAITAALKAEDPQRAIELADTYLKEMLPYPLRAQIASLRTHARQFSR